MCEDPLVIEMEDLEGGKTKVRIVKLFEDGGRSYVVADDLMDDTASYIFEVIERPDGDELHSIESEEEFNRLCRVLEELEEE